MEPLFLNPYFRPKIWGGRKLKDIFNYDIGICGWGSACGEVLEGEGKYCLEYFIKINNDKYKNKVINLLKNTDFKKVFPSVSTPYVSKWQIYKYIKEQIPEIE